jgi:acetyl esterase/lipase
VIHGGGWVGGKRDADRERQMGDVFAKAGFVAASIDYQLSEGDKPSWPQNLYDCKTAVRYLRKNAAKYGINPNRMGVIGGSAGGHLAMMVAYTGGNSQLDPPGPYGEYSTKVQAVVNLYGVPLMDANHTGKNMLMNLANDETYRAASPATYVTRSSPPMLMMHGTADKTVPIAWSDEFEQILRQRGASYTYKRIEGAPHTFLINSKYGDFRELITGFFREHLTAK